jgi:tetratricopeptide (TPR) repeat protein
MLRLGRQSIDIAPDDPHYTIDDAFVLPVDVEVHAVQPHAHYRAREVMGIAQLPDGRVRPLIHIREWDFRWQHVYRYATPFVLPKGTTLAMRYVYDNSAANARNPVQPPRRVLWGQRSQDEMGDLWIQVLPQTAADAATLQAAFGPKVLAEDLLGYQRELDRDPTSVALHNDIAMLHLRLGRHEQAVEHFAAAAKLDPRSSVTHFNLGTALTLAGRLSEAMGQFSLALKLDPSYAQAHNNLGNILLGMGRTGEALPHLEEAVQLDPSNVQARFSLAEAFAAGGDWTRARTMAQSALALSPPEPLASVLREALSRYER